MKKSRSITLIVPLVILILLAACNLPSADETQVPASDLVFTQAAQTVQAEMTRLAPTQEQQQPAATTAAPTISFPTNTQQPPATATAIPCNQAAFEADVTIPDGTVLSPGQVFTKTWRLRNAGSCTWTSGYQLVFHQGDGMGAPSGYAQSLTAGTVPPGGTVDISVTLTAPMTAGTYKGYWRLREPGGAYFALRNNSDFWVQIQVATSATNTVTLNAVTGESGTVRGDGAVTTTELIAGDASDDNGLQVFLSFDISSIPINATITEVRIDFTNYTVHGDPFAGLGCINVYESNYGVLNAGDFYLGVPTLPFYEWCSTAALSNVVSDNDFKNLIQSRLGNTRIQARVQFPDLFTDGDGVADAIRLNAPKLSVIYTTP
ncbi:MAG: hypothetical protein JXB85_12150 [Anaerolineales bacterium]|nr:hypothetical protein [Anaerolineales bacterium]